MEHLRGPIHKFAMALFAACKKQTGDDSGNFLFSPMTASTGLLLIMSGANGLTKDEMNTALHLTEMPEFQTTTGEKDVHMAFRRVMASFSKQAKERMMEGADDCGVFQVFRINKLFIQEGVTLMDEFVDSVKKLRGEIQYLDFRQNPNAARKVLNEYVQQELNGHCTECFSSGSISSSSQMVLTNGICFRARWETTFDGEKTRMKTFRQQNGRTVETPTMNGIFHLAYFQDFITKVTYLEIPYLHNAASFLIILPMKPNGLQEVQKSLTPGAINRFNLSKRMREIDLHLPKFQMQSTFNLKGALQKLGIKSLFSEQADLTRMTPQNVSLSAAAHSGFFGIDEKGTDARKTTSNLITEAAGKPRKVVSSLAGTTLGAPPEKTRNSLVSVEVAHPFLFAVRHNKSGLMIWADYENFGNSRLYTNLPLFDTRPNSQTSTAAETSWILPAHAPVPPLSIEAKFKESALIPDVIPVAPTSVLKVAYKSGAKVEFGNELNPRAVSKEPAVHWEANDNDYYTLSMSDPDAMSRENPQLREWQHWLVVNIPGNKMEKGEVLTAYVGSGPSSGTGKHRYAFVVYRQAGRVVTDEQHITNRSANGRSNFRIRRFAEKYELGDPVAGNFFEAQFDDYVVELYKQLGVIKK